MKTYRWHFKITKELLEGFEFNFFAKLKNLFDNCRIEGEDYRGDIIISFESNVPYVEGFEAQVHLTMRRKKDDTIEFLPIEYPK